MAVELRRPLKREKANSVERLALFGFAVASKERTRSESEQTQNASAVKRWNHEEIGDPSGHSGFIVSEFLAYCFLGDKTGRGTGGLVWIIILLVLFSLL